MGRPKIEFDREAIANCVKQGFNWKEIARVLGYSYSTLMGWKETQDFSEVLTKLGPGPELAEEVRLVAGVQPNMGAKAVSSFLLNSGKSVRRKDVREALYDMNPEASAKRKKYAIKRREYNIVVAHELWHHDGWHKLVKYGIVVHGCVDGATRAIIYAEAADNNRAATVFEIFQRTRGDILPHRVRGDRGGENKMILRFMNAVGHPLPRIGYIPGRSVHNTRIEGLWRHMRLQCTQFYMDLFKEMTDEHNVAGDDGEEEDGEVFFLDCTNDEHLFVLHHVFIPLINESLTLWKGAWNCHKLRTEHSHTPNQLLLGFKEWYPHALDERHSLDYANAIRAIAAAVFTGASSDEAAAAGALIQVQAQAEAGGGNVAAANANGFVGGAAEEQLPEDYGDGDDVDQHEYLDDVEHQYLENLDAPWVRVLPRRCGLDVEQLEDFRTHVVPCTLESHPLDERDRLKQAFFDALDYYEDCKLYEYH